MSDGAVVAVESVELGATVSFLTGNAEGTLALLNPSGGRTILKRKAANIRKLKRYKPSAMAVGLQLLDQPW